MAIEDLITRPLPNVLEGLPAGIQTGFDLALKKAQVQQQQQLNEIKQQEIRLNAGEKFAELLPKLKGLKPQEKKLMMSGLVSYAKTAGVEVPDTFFEYLDASPEYVETLASAAKAAKAKYPGQSDLQVAEFMDHVEKAGLDITKAKEITAVWTAKTLAEVKEKEFSAKETLKEEQAFGKAVAAAAPDQAFLDEMNRRGMSTRDKTALLEQRKAGLDELTKARAILVSEPFLKNVPPNSATYRDVMQGFAAGQELINSPDPNKIALGRSLIKSMEMAAMRGMGAGYAATQESEETKKKREENFKMNKAVQDLAKFIQESNKDVVESINTGYRVMNILNNPNLAQTAVGTDAIISLIARWIDPKTGVREGEQQRIAKAAAGGVMSRVEMLARSITEGRTLDADQREVISNLVNLELRAARREVANIEASIKTQAERMEISTEEPIRLAFGKYSNKEFTPDLVPSSLFEKDKKTKESWWKRVKTRFFGTPEYPRAKSPSEYPAGEEIIRKIDESGPGPVVSSGVKSSLSRLMKPAQISVPGEPSPSAQAQPKASEMPKDINKMSEQELYEFFMSGTELKSK